MNFYQFKYNIKCLLHNRMDLFWVLVFPIALGTFFHISFSNILDTTETFNAIPVAIVLNDSQISMDFQIIADTLGENGDDQLLSIVYTDADNAESLLKDKKVDGIIIADEFITLSVSDSMGSSQIQQSILESFVKEYNSNYKAVQAISISHPEKLQDTLFSLNESAVYLQQKSLTSGNMNMMLQYFFNLMAMACLYTSFTGCNISIKNQANLSPIGARKNMSPINKLMSILSEFFANLIIQFCCLCVVLAYLIFVLKIDFGPHPLLVLCSIFVSCMLGLSLGIFIGCIGHISKDLKSGILVASCTFSCFLSGLMVDNMRPMIEKYCPIINMINPGALISDCFYSLSIYDTYERFTRSIVTILILTVIFLFGTFLIVRRKKYASL